MASTERQMEDFLQSSVWQDIVTELKDMRESCRNELETCKDLDELMRFQGRSEVLRDIIILPEEMLRALQEDKVRKVSEEEMIKEDDLQQ